MKSFWLICAATLLCSACAPQAAVDGGRPLQRNILNLSLGEGRWHVSRDYPNFNSCPSAVARGGLIKRWHLSAACVKTLPAGVSEMWLAFEHSSLGEVLEEIQIVYDASFTRQKSAEALADDVSLVYGPPQHTQGKFWWADNRTVMRVFYAEVPTAADDSSAISLRTSFQLIDAGLFRK